MSKQSEMHFDDLTAKVKVLLMLASWGVEIEGKSFFDLKLAG